jgi:hypothetical protein
MQNAKTAVLPACSASHPPAVGARERTEELGARVDRWRRRGVAARVLGHERGQHGFEKIERREEHRERTHSAASQCTVSARAAVEASRTATVEFMSGLPAAGLVDAAHEGQHEQYRYGEHRQVHQPSAARGQSVVAQRETAPA